MQANLIKILAISENDLIFQKELLDIIQEEFILEKEEFLINYKAQNYIFSAGIVHKLKHKINLLNLRQGYSIALKFEEELKQNKTESFYDFIKVLESIEAFLKTI